MTQSMKILFLISFSFLLGFGGQDVFAETEMTGWLRIMDSYSTDPGLHPYLFWFQSDDQATPYRLNPQTLPSNILDLAGEKVRITVDDGEDIPLVSSLNPMEQFLDIVSIEMINQPLQSSPQKIEATVKSVTLLSKFSDVAVTPSEIAGTGPGQFLEPQGVAVDGSGNIFVADSVNHRIQKFDSNGDFLLKFGSPGSGNGQLLFPTGVAVDISGNIYVADNNNHRIQKFDSSGVFVLKFGANSGDGTSGTGEGEFSFPFGIAVDSSGNIYVADTNNSRIQIFDSSGNFTKMFGFGVDDGTDVFQKCTAGCQAGIASAGEGGFAGPRGVTVDGSGNIFVADTGVSRIQKFNPANDFLLKFGTNNGNGGTGTGNGDFDSPRGVAVDGSGDIYVADTGNDRIQIFNSAGVFQSKFGSSGSGDGQFNSPEGITTGSIYVADKFNDRVKKFNINGTFNSELGFDGSLSHDSAYYQDIFYDSPGSLKNYYLASSYGKFTWNGSVDDWKTLAGIQTDYSIGPNFDLMVTDAIEAHDPFVDFCSTPVTNLILVFNGNVDSSGSAFGSLGTWPNVPDNRLDWPTDDTCFITISVTWEPDNGGFFCCGQLLDRGIGVTAHELGHNLEFEHTPPPPGLWCPSSCSPYNDPNSVMSTNIDLEGPSALITGQRDDAGWMAAENKVTIADGTSSTITLDFSNEPEGGVNPQMAIVPLESLAADTYYIIEGHKEGLFNDTPQDRTGAIMYKHFPPPGNQYAYLSSVDKSAEYSLVATAGTDAVSDFDLAILEVGETYVDVANSVTVTTLSRNATSVTVFVSNNASADMDGDGVSDVDDNCPNVSNPLQEDLDADGIGDVCDTLNEITVDTVVSSNFTSLGNLIVQDNSLLTINSGVTVTIPSSSNITIQSGSGVLIKSGGTLNVIA